MSVLIKGMDMPKKGEYHMTLYVDSDSAYIDVESFQEDEDKFEVIQVPPHGRLIDADALIATEKEQFKLLKTVNLGYDMAQRDALVRSITNIINAPTIILAETDLN